MASPHLEKWYTYFKSGDTDLLGPLLHEDVVFTSPVVHTPQKGTRLTHAYLAAATDVLGSNKFSYIREFDCGSRAVLEFTCEIDGVEINGVDLIEWDNEGKIIDFKVMIRPLKAINIVHMKMGEMLAQMQASRAAGLK